MLWRQLQAGRGLLKTTRGETPCCATRSTLAVKGGTDIRPALPAVRKAGPGRDARSVDLPGQHDPNPRTSPGPHRRIIEYDGSAACKTPSHSLRMRIGDVTGF